MNIHYIVHGILIMIFLITLPSFPLTIQIFVPINEVILVNIICFRLEEKFSQFLPIFNESSPDITPLLSENINKKAVYISLFSFFLSLSSSLFP